MSRPAKKTSDTGNTSHRASNKEPFPTSQEVLQRLHWDPHLHVEDYVVGYDERFKGRREKRANEFPLHGEIPWHRVWQIRLGRMVIWDRERREHRLVQLHELQRKHEEGRPPRPPAQQKPCALQAHQPHRFDQRTQAWTPATNPDPIALSGTLRVCTYNVLFDLYEKEKVRADLRMPALQRLLDESEADIIGLQEITPSLLEGILACPWVRQRYYVSAIPDSTSITPYGQILLSRAPIQQLMTLAHSPHKRSLIAILATTPTPLGAIVVHLTSDRRQDASERRQTQLTQLCDFLDNQHPALTQAPELAPPTNIPWLLLGDFNTRGDEVQELLDANNFTDLWTWLHPQKPGYTFAPADNPLAALASQSQRPGRLDRILLRDANAPLMMMPSHIRMLGCEPIENTQVPEGLSALHPSDHFGVLCSLQVS